MEKEDLVLICKDCNNEFIFSITEQEFYKGLGFNNPVRCKACRKAKKQRSKNYNNKEDYEKKSIETKAGRF